MIVQTDLANGFDLGICLNQLPVLLQNGLSDLVRRIGVGANGGVEIVILPGQRIRIPGRTQAAARIHYQSQPLRGQCIQKLTAVGVKSPIVQMGVGIKQHKLFSFYHCHQTGIYSLPVKGFPVHHS